MLVLQRRVDEAIHIGDDVRIVVVGIRDGKVRLRVEAPRGIPVHRDEIYRLIHGQQRPDENSPKTGSEVDP